MTAVAPNIHLGGGGRCPSGVSGSSALVSTQGLCDDMGGAYVDGACSVDHCKDTTDCATGKIHPQVQLQGACPPGSEGVYDEDADVCTLQNACLEIAPVTINLAGANRCELVGKGMTTSERYVEAAMTEEECKSHGGKYSGGKCKLYVCEGDAPACTPDDTFRPAMTLDTACDAYTPGSTNATDPSKCDVSNVCIRTDPGNPFRLHLIRPGLECVQEGLDKGIETYEGEVLIANLTAEQCAKKGGTYLAEQCQLSAVNKLTHGKCPDFTTGAGKFKSTDTTGPVAGLSREACESAGGVYQETTGMCENASYCQVSDPGETACKNSVLLWFETRSPVPLWIAIGAVSFFLIVSLSLNAYLKRKDLKKKLIWSQFSDRSARDSLLSLGNQATAEAYR